MTIPQFKIGDRLIGEGAACLVIGEVAQAHDGSLGIAHAFIDAIASAGADAVKFQTHIARAESTPQEPFRVKFSLQDASRYDYWKRMEFSEDQWFALAEHAHQRGLIFLSSPFSEEAVDMLSRVGMLAWKVASGEVRNPLLLESMLSRGQPILLSTGMSSLEEIDEVVEKVKRANVPLAIFQCTSSYPSIPEDIGLNMLEIFHDRYQVPVGLSDHSGKIFPGLAAVTLGASLLEVHVTLSREMFGPDVPSSLTIQELKQLVEGAGFIKQALNNPVNKDTKAKEMCDMRAIFGRSLVFRHDLRAGHILQRGDLTALKPGTGIPVERLNEYLSKKLVRDVSAGEFVSPLDLKNG